MHTRTRAVLARIMCRGRCGVLPTTSSQGYHAGRCADRAGSFDAIRDLAEVFPISVFPDALGIDREGASTFSPMAHGVRGLGPENDYFRELMKQAPTVLPWNRSEVPA